MKIKIHPTAIIIGIILVWRFGIDVCFFSFISITIHEFCHALIAKERGYNTGNILLMPYGLVLYNPNNFDKFSNIIIAIAGPLANFLLSLSTFAFFWIYPSSFLILKDFAYCNIVYGLFNLFPVYPLDGGRIILALLTINQ